MTSRQRVVEAIEHRQPDRTPIDFNPVADFYLKLKEHLGLEIDENLSVGFMEEAIPHPKVLDALGADMISGPAGSALEITNSGIDRLLTFIWRHGGQP